MCLGTKLSNSSLARYKAKGKKCGYIRVWKVVDDTGRKFTSQFGYYDRKLYKKGYAAARPDAEDEQGLIHAFRDRKSAKRWNSYLTTVSCVVAPEWVMALGHAGKNGSAKLTLTTKAIVMPEYPKHKVTVREFRAAIKGKKVKKYSWEK